MVVCAIDIAGKEARFSVLQAIDGQITDVTGDFKKLSIENDEESESVKSFFETYTAHMDSINPDVIAVLKRFKAGDFASSAMTFKIEGILQLYKRKDVQMISPATIRAFKKRKPIVGTPKFKYQKEAFELAFYILNRE
jgi:hypothetical protein